MGAKEMKESLIKSRENNIARLRAAKPDGRKSYGSYKPVIVYPTPVLGSGYAKKTEVLGRDWTESKYERGETFNTKAEAAEFAARVIEERVAALEKDIEKIEARYK